MAKDVLDKAVLTVASSIYN